MLQEYHEQDGLRNGVNGAANDAVGRSRTLSTFHFAIVRYWFIGRGGDCHFEGLPGLLLPFDDALPLGYVPAIQAKHEPRGEGDFLVGCELNATFGRFVRAARTTLWRIHSYIFDRIY